MLADFITPKHHLNFQLSKYWYIILLVAFFVIGLCVIDNPIDKRYNEDKAYYTFIRNTPIESVFANPYLKSAQGRDLLLVGQRATFSPSGFPFSESSMLEYQYRKKMLFSHNLSIEYYQALKPIDFKLIAQIKQLDYVIIEKAHANNFKHLKASFENEKVLIYSIKQL